MNASRTPKRIIGGALLSSGVVVAGWGLGAGTAHAGAYHWFPGDPPPKAVVPDGRGGFTTGPVDPA
jgi:hypothetical protein